MCFVNNCVMIIVVEVVVVVVIWILCWGSNDGGNGCIVFVGSIFVGMEGGGGGSGSDFGVGGDVVLLVGF